MGIIPKKNEKEVKDDRVLRSTMVEVKVSSGTHINFRYSTGHAKKVNKDEIKKNYVVESELNEVVEMLKAQLIKNGLLVDDNGNIIMSTTNLYNAKENDTEKILNNIEKEINEMLDNKEIELGRHLTSKEIQTIVYEKLYDKGEK